MPVPVTVPDGGTVVPLEPKIENALAGTAGKEKGAADGVMVEEPMTRRGAVPDAAGYAVPVSTAVTVVEDITSVKVTRGAGPAVVVGLVVCSKQEN